MSKRAVNLLRNMAVPALHNASNPVKGAVRQVLTSTNSDPRTLTAADSGAIVRMTGTAHTCTLPAPTEGASYRIAVGAAVNMIVSTAGTNVFYGQNLHSTAGTTVAIVDLRATGILTLAGGVIGDFFDIWCDGTNWYVFALTDAAVTPTTH